MPHTHALSLWDGLLTSVDTARAAALGGDHGGAERAVARSCAYVSELYSTLDCTRSPIVAAHLQSVLDVCLKQLGGGGGGLSAIEGALVLLRPVRAAIAM